MYRLAYILMSALVCLLSAHLFAPPTVEAFPSEKTTGITDKDCPNWSQRKTNTSGRTISTDGAVIDYEEISGGGGLNINAKNVTIRCVKIDARFSDRYGINCFSGECAGLLVENVDITRCTSACATARGAAGNPSIWRRVHLHNTQKDVLKLESYAILEDSYLHGYSPVAGSHNDAIQTAQGSHIEVVGNTIEGPTREQTSAYLMKSDFGKIDDVLIENNLLSGGTYSLYVYDGGHGVPTNVSVINNVFVKNSYKYGSHSVQAKSSTCFEWSNNRFGDNSSLSAPSSVSPDGSCHGGSGREPQEPEQVSAPSIRPNGGDFSGTVTVKIETPEAGATVYYTLNDSTPTERSKVYEGPIELSSSTTVKAIAVKDGMDSSPVRDATFRIDDRDPEPEDNRAPVASAGKDVQVKTSEKITFDASDSSDPDDDRLRYEWDFDDGGSDDGKVVAHLFLDPGEYRVRLTVSDGSASDSDVVIVKVTDDNDNGDNQEDQDDQDDQDDQGGQVDPGDQDDQDDQGGQVDPGDQDDQDDQGGQVDPGDQDDQDDQDKSGRAAFFEDFEGYGSNQDPDGWRDTQDQNSMNADQSLFETASVGNSKVFGTTSQQTNIHTHYQGKNARDWTNYTFSGRMYLVDSRGGLGVTFFSQYSEGKDHYYRLRRYDGNGAKDFHLAPHGTSVSGDTHSGVVPEAKTWYQFRIEVSDAGEQTEIRAKVWKDGTSEPSKFQIEATDSSSNRLRSGTIGLWSMRDGGKYFDQLKVR